MKTLAEKVAELPLTPGVYLFKDKLGKVIYVGKAARLRVRVGSYFRRLEEKDDKTRALVPNIRDLSHIDTPGEFEALFLESELIKRYKPKYNVIWQDDKNWLYIKVNLKDTYPTIEYVRRPLDDGARYLGPFIDPTATKSTLRLLRRVFPYHTHKVMPKRACLDYHLGLCLGPEIGAVSETDYRRMVFRLIAIIEGKESRVLKEMEKEMRVASRARDYEMAARYRDQIHNLKRARQKVVFGQGESVSLSADQGLSQMVELLGLVSIPLRIEAYDISHIQGSGTTASMVVFERGIPARDEYRRFKIGSVKGVDDFASIREVIKRRFTRSNSAKKQWSTPDLVLIDGGKGQLSAADGIMKQLVPQISRIGLAKREEIIVTLDDSGNFGEIKLPSDSDALKLLQRIRDEAHRFAITYHGLLETKKSSRSKLDELPGVGEATRKKLIKAFGSVRGVVAASEDEISQIVGPKLAKVIKESL